jgi:hypothetical protein
MVDEPLPMYDNRHPEHVYRLFLCLIDLLFSLTICVMFSVFEDLVESDFPCLTLFSLVLFIFDLYQSFDKILHIPSLS